MSPRRPFDTAAPSFTIPSAAWRAAALKAPATLETHAALMADPEAEALWRVRMRPGPATAAPAEALTVAAWNVERGRDVADIVRILAASEAAVVLLTEVDIGMARSGNRDTIEEIAAGLGMHQAAGVEFIELGLGDVRESAVYAGIANEAGLHCNAVLSRWPIARAVVLPLDEGGYWFAGQPDPHQRRIGSRHALAALVDAGFGPVWFAAAHFESHGEPPDRAAEMARLMAALDALAPRAPVVLGGDFNTKLCTEETLPAGLENLPQEPLFGESRAHGFDHMRANTLAPTTRPRAWHTEPPPLRRLDWLFTRGLTVAEPKIWPAVDASREAISDHELITLRISS